MEIKRDSYLEQLKIRKDNGMIKIITGIRRCGKSFLLFAFFKKYLLESGMDNDHIIEIALDGIENSAIGTPTNPTKISNTFKSERGINYSNKTISNHIDYLVEVFLISKADRYDIKGRRLLQAPCQWGHRLPGPCIIRLIRGNLFMY